MTHAEAIQVIEQLYPADSASTDTAVIGKQLLEAARALEWRNESDAVLFEYSRLCEEKRRIEEEEVESTLDRYRERFPPPGKHH